MNKSEFLEFIVEDYDLEHKRLDKLISFKFPDLSRSLIKKMYDKGLIKAE